ncbi:MAG: potassium-transporting ATPase subunit F [Thermoplasmata archaeon]|nr:potassium-transporting ATPase subunit F [Thermoplasmata archaeon]
MGLLAALAQNLGLVALTVLALALSGYLAYSMLHPERF